MAKPKGKSSKAATSKKVAPKKSVSKKKPITDEKVLGSDLQSDEHPAQSAAAPEYLGPQKVLIVSKEDYLNPKNGRMYKRVKLSDGTTMVLSEQDLQNQLAK